MKRGIFFTLIMAAALSAGAQSVEKTMKINDGSKMVYNVDPATNAKTGLFAIQNTKNDGLWMQGRYQADNRVGTWYFFDAKNKLAMRYNYDQKKVVYIDTTALFDVKIDILTTNAEEKKGASVPLPVCSVDYYMSLIVSKVYADNGLSEAEVTAHIDVDGKATYTVSYLQDNKKSPKKKLEIGNGKVNIDWVPSMYNNKPVASEFTVYTTVKGDDAYSAAGERRFRWNN